MGVPQQGSGPTTSWSDDGSGYDPGPYPLPNDGAQWSFATVMYLLARIINSLGALYTGGAMQLPVQAGNIPIVAGPAITWFRLVAQVAARIDASNVFSASQTFSSGVTCDETLHVEGAVTCDTTLLVTGILICNANWGLSGSGTIGGLVTCAGGLTVPTGQTLTIASGATLALNGTLTSAGLTSTGLIEGQAGAVLVNNATVSAATGNSVSPIVLTLPAAAVAQLATNDFVLVYGATGNTAMNGMQRVTVLTSTTVSLQGTTGNGTYTANSATVVLNSALFVNNGWISLDGAQPPLSSSDPGGDNALWGVSVCKAWGNVSTNGSGGGAVGDGYNIASVTVSNTGPLYPITVTFARAMANTNYTVTFAPVWDGTNLILPVLVSTFSTTSFSFALMNLASPPDAFNGHGTAYPAITGLGLCFQVLARQ
jgi:hypothetical protein